MLKENMREVTISQIESYMGKKNVE